jgi:8-oxo-dGTP diphosphatase
VIVILLRVVDSGVNAATRKGCIMPIDKFKLYATVHLFLIHNSKILLLRRFNTGYEDGNYSVIAGYLNGEEQIKVAMVREALEEAGIVLSVGDLRVIGVMHRKPIEEHIDFFLAATTWSGEIVNKEPDKCDELAWFDEHMLPKNVIPYIRKALNNFRQNDYRGMWFDTFDW